MEAKGHLPFWAKKLREQIGEYVEGTVSSRNT